MIYLKDILYVYIVSQFYQLIFSQFLLKNKWNVILYEERKKREKKKKIETEQRSCTMKTEFREVKGTGVVRPPRRQQPRRSATTRDPFSPNHGRLPSETPVRNAKRERHWSSGTKMDRREGEERKGDGKGKRKEGGGRGRERRKKAWRLSKFKLPVSQPRHERERGPRLRRRNSTEPREPLAKHVPWCGTGDRGRSQVQNPCASTSQGLGFGVTFAGIFVSTSDFTSFRCLCYMLYLENRQGSRESRFLLEAFERYDIYICCIYQANIYDEHSREYISCVGSYPHHSANSPWIQWSE